MLTLPRDPEHTSVGIAGLLTQQECFVGSAGMFALGQHVRKDERGNKRYRASPQACSS
jgi:hypothetical protein